MPDDFHLAQINLGRMVAPTDAPEVAEFMAALDPINALADASPGFVWRLQDDSGNATSIHVFDDELLLINMSVWESIETLWQFAYKTHHVDYFRRRREWFETNELALWWVPAGHTPSIEEAKERLEHLDAHGPTPYAFTFKQRYPPGAASSETALPSSGSSTN